MCGVVYRSNEANFEYGSTSPPFNYLFQPLVEILRNLLPGMDSNRLPTVVLTDEIGIKHEIYSDATLSSAVSAAINNKYGHWYRLRI